MIRKALIAVACLAAGLAALHVTIGVENFLPRRGADGDQPIKESTSDGRVGAGVVVGGIDGSEGEAAIAVSGEGRFEVRSVEERRMADGRTLFLPRYVLVAADSETIAEDLVRLRDVELTFFDLVEAPGADPQAQPRGDVRAREAVVQVGRDADGMASIRADRDMDLFGVVLDAVVGDGEPRRVRLEVARLQGRQTADGLVFRTPSEREAFRIELAEDPPAILTGRGIAGSVPMDRSRGTLALDVRSDPVLRQGDSRLSARGRMVYRENLELGAASLLLEDTVAFEGVDTRKPARPRLTARGDRLVATLARVGTAADGTGGTVYPRVLRLTGTPTVLTAPVSDAPGAAPVRLTCADLQLRVDAAGSPWAATADGQPELFDPASGLRFRAERRIHVVEPSRLLGPIHAAYGFRTPVVSRGAARVLAFEGATRIDDEARGLTVDAADGLDLFLGADAAPRPRDGETAADRPAVLATAFGRGASTLASRVDGIEATGSDGFVLVQDGERRTLRLGPATPDPEHHFVVRASGEPGQFTLRGRGGCRADFEVDGSLVLRVADPTGGTAVSAAEGSLENLASLYVALRPDESIGSLTAGGRLARFRLRFAGERLAGTARRVRSDGRSLFLDGEEGVELQRWRDDAPVETARGARIDVHRRGSRASIHVHGYADGRLAEIDASIPAVDLRDVGPDGAEPREADATPPAAPPAATAGAEQARLWLAAVRIDLLPELLPGFVAARYGIAAVPETAIGGPALLATGSVALERRSPDGSVDVRADGDELTLFAGRRRGLLRGNDATIRLRDQDRESIGEAGRIRFAAIDRARLLVALLPTGPGLPRLYVRSAADDGLDPALRHARIICDGTIELDGSDLDFGGPVRVQSLDADGAVDPAGLDLSSADLALDWDPASRALRSVTASGGADVAMRGVRARGDAIGVDFASTTLRVQGADDRPAHVDLGRGVVTAWLLQVDYRARTVQAWYGRGAVDR